MSPSSSYSPIVPQETVPFPPPILAPELYPHTRTCCTWELRDNVPDNNGTSKWKRLTNMLDVITLRVDLILWALFLSSH